MQPWLVIERFETPEGVMELRRRGERDYLITVDGRVLMTSVAHRSEDQLAIAACKAVADRPRPKILIGGLGMGYTLRAALDALPREAEVTMVELNQQIVAWCQGPLATLTSGAVRDPRVKVRVDDVARVIATAPPSAYDALVIDLYEGPHSNGIADPLYGVHALDRSWKALRPGGVFAIWSEETDQTFEARLVTAGFDVKRERGGRGGRAHIVYLATRPEGPRRDAAQKPMPRPTRR